MHSPILRVISDLNMTVVPMNGGRPAFVYFTHDLCLQGEEFAYNFVAHVRLGCLPHMCKRLAEQFRVVVFVSSRCCAAAEHQFFLSVLSM